MKEKKSFHEVKIEYPYQMRYFKYLEGTDVFMNALTRIFICFERILLINESYSLNSFYILGFLVHQKK